MPAGRSKNLWVDGGDRNVDNLNRIFYKEGVSSMRPYENSFVPWNNKSSDSKKKEKAARVFVDVDQFSDGSADRDLLLTAMSA